MSCFGSWLVFRWFALGCCFACEVFGVGGLDYGGLLVFCVGCFRFGCDDFPGFNAFEWCCCDIDFWALRWGLPFWWVWVCGFWLTLGGFLG